MSYLEFNFLEAGHGKGVADGIGAVIKRTADGYVNQGGDVTGSDDLIMALESKGTSVELEITEHQIKEIDDDLPISVKSIAKTMRYIIHQVFGIILSIFYSYVLYNKCYIILEIAMEIHVNVYTSDT